MASPQQMTRDNLTARGYLVSTVERRKEFPDKKRRPCAACGHQPRISVSVDLFNCFDIVGFRPAKIGMDVICVQTTSAANHATRRNKILASMEAKLVLLSGARVLLQSWSQLKPRAPWICRDEWIEISAFRQAPNYPDDVAGLLEIRRKAKKDALPPGSEMPYGPIKESEIPF